MTRDQPTSSVRALTIACTDVERSEWFYQSMLGASRLRTDNGVGRWYRLGSLDLNLLPNAVERKPARFPDHAMPILWLAVDDLVVAAAWFSRHEVEVIEPEDGQFMLIADPDGLVIEVWRSQPEDCEAGQHPPAARSVPGPDAVVAGRHEAV